MSEAYDPWCDAPWRDRMTEEQGDWLLRAAYCAEQRAFWTDVAAVCAVIALGEVVNVAEDDGYAVRAYRAYSATARLRVAGRIARAMVEKAVRG